MAEMAYAILKGRVTSVQAQVAIRLAGFVGEPDPYGARANGDTYLLVEKPGDGLFAPRATLALAPAERCADLPILPDEADGTVVRCGRPALADLLVRAMAEEFGGRYRCAGSPGWTSCEGRRNAALTPADALVDALQRMLPADMQHVAFAVGKDADLLAGLREAIDRVLDEAPSPGGPGR